MPPTDDLMSMLPEDRGMVHRNWWVFILIGAVILALGIAGLFLPVVFTLVAVVLVGWLFAFAGLFEIVNAIIRRGWSRFWVDLLSGLLSLAVGVMILMRPVAGAEVLTVLVGFMFLIGGIFRVWAGVALRRSYGVWIILHGVISTLLGILVLAGWPESSEWVLGTLVAIDLIFSGSRLISLGAVARDWPEEESAPAPTPS